MSGIRMKLIQRIDNEEFELVATKELHKIKEIVVYIKNIEKAKKCARECPALCGLRKIIGGA